MLALHARAPLAAVAAAFACVLIAPARRPAAPPPKQTLEEIIQRADATLARVGEMTRGVPAKAGNKTGTAW
ncbi:MAG TPA: hypothetical protein VL326_38920 [Kofleriaceae bacterium]|nr:hypothetical protein [Kofleriaceae bacterium]